MSFIVHLGLPPFFKALSKGSTVYIASYALADNPDGFVLLTSDAGVSDGVIHALRLTIKPDPESEKPEPDKLELSLSLTARELLEQFCIDKGLNVHLGSVLLTEGLERSIEYWSRNIDYTLKELADSIKAGLAAIPTGQEAIPT